MTRTDPTLLTSWDHPIMLPTSPRPLEPTSTSTSHTHHQSIHHPTSSHLHNPTPIQILTQDPTQLSQDPTPTHVLIGRSNPTSIVGKHHPSHDDDDDMDDTETESERDLTDDIDKTHHLTIPRYRSRSFSSASSSSSSSSPSHRDLSPSPRAHQRDDWSHHISSPTRSNPSSQHTSSTTSVAVSSSPSPDASPSSFSSRSPSHMISSRRISSLSSSSHMSSPHSYTSSPLRRHRQLHPISPDILSPCALELGVIAMHHGRPHFPHTPSEPNSPLLENRIISCSAPSSTLIKSRLLSTSSSSTSSSSTSISTPASPSHSSISSSPLSLNPRYLRSPQQTNSVLAMKQRSNSWSSIASTYAQFFHEYFTRFAEIAMHMVMERSPWSPDAYILDVGAGTGALSLTTARHGYRTCAIDYSPDMIHILNTKRTQQHLSEAILHSVIMDAQAMGFPDSRFDVVFAMFCVMLFPSKTIGLTEMYRVLKPGGYMVMTLWDDEYATEWNVLHTQAMRMVRPDRGFDMITHSHDRDATVALLQSVGFTNVEMTPGVSLTYTVEDPTSFWHALAQVTSTRFLLDTYFTKQQQQRVQHTFISLLQQRGDPETGVIKLTGRATFYIAKKPMNTTIVKDSSVIASSSTSSSSISLVTIPSPVPSLFPPTCVSPPISISSSSSSCSSDSPSSSFKLPPPVTSTSPAMSCNSSTSSSMDVPEDTSTS